MMKTMRGGSLRGYSPSNQVGRVQGGEILSTDKDILQEGLQDFSGTPVIEKE